MRFAAFKHGPMAESSGDGSKRDDATKIAQSLPALLPRGGTATGRGSTISRMALSLAEVVAETGATEPEVREYVAAGIARADQAGLFSDADVQRIKAVKGFVDAGVAWPHMRRAIDERLVTFQYVDAFLLDPAPPTGRTYAEFRTSLGERAARLSRVFDALGLAEPPASKPMRADEEKCLAELVELWSRVGGDDALLRAARLLGEPVRRATEGWMALWAEYMAERTDLELPLERRRDVTLELGAGLTELLPSMMVWLEQQYLERAMTSVGVEQMEQALAERGIAPEPMEHVPAVMFVDLTAYSALTERHGDAEAVRLATTLRDTVEGVARRHGGTLVKLLGDGAMLSFDRTADAIRAGCQLLTAKGWDPQLPEPHIGIHAGPVIERDGDLFGSTVNIAARLSAAAAPGQLLVSDAAIEAAGALPGLEAVPLGSVDLKNIGRPVAAYAVTLA